VIELIAPLVLDADAGREGFERLNSFQRRGGPQTSLSREQPVFDFLGGIIEHRRCHPFLSSAVTVRQEYDARRKQRGRP
jgi:hypothetical protein